MIDHKLRTPTLTALCVAILVIAGINIPRIDASEPYCGVYSLYVSAQALDRPVEFESLLENKYVIGWEGSSIDSLSRAARDLGLASQPLQGMASWDLRFAPGPVVLHVRSELTRPHYDHWVAYLGEQDGKARIVDPSRGEQLIHYSDLLAAWDGAGLAISDSNTLLQMWRWKGWTLRLMIFLGIGCVLSCALRVVLRWLLNGQKGLVCEVTRLGVAAIALVLLAIALDFASGAGTLGNAHASRTITNLYFPIEFDEVSTQELELLFRNLSVEKNFQLIDARMASDFQYYPLPGAINIPVNCSVTYEAEAVSSFDRNTPLIVYCQSRGCSYSHSVAKRLHAREFENIRIYADGVAGWTEQQRLAIRDTSKPSVDEGEDP